MRYPEVGPSSVEERGSMTPPSHGAFPDSVRTTDAHVLLFNDSLNAEEDAHRFKQDAIVVVTAVNIRASLH